MEASHAICARIQISYPDGRIKNPAWNNEQVNKLTKQSPLFERQLLRLMQDEQHVWKIELKETDDFYDVDLDPFIVNLGRPQGRNSSNGMEVNSLSRRCSAMWYFEVVPSKVHLASYATGNDGETIASNSPTPITSSTPTLVSGNSASRAPTVSESSSSESESWCWHHNDDHKSPETSLKLANIALVLDWREVFRREIKTVVWNWRPRETLADPKTPVDCLRKDGVKGLNRRRERELKEIKDWFEIHFTNNPKLPQKVKDILQEHGPDEFDDQNPYSWMKSLENILLPSHRPPRRPSGISQVTMVARNHHRGGNPSGPTLSKVIKKLAVQISDRPENRKFVVEKLTEAHKFIEERQDKVAEKLLAWRDRQIGRWKKVLDERDLAETPNGASIQATAASSSRIEEEQRQQQAGGSTAEEG